MSTIVGGPSSTQPEPYAGSPADGARALPEQHEQTEQQQQPELHEEAGRPEPAPAVAPAAAPPSTPVPAAAPAPPAPPPAPAAAVAPEPAATDPDADPSRPLTRVRISHGDLRFARHHVLVGHYPGSTLLGGEGALD